MQQPIRLARTVIHRDAADNEVVPDFQELKTEVLGMSPFRISTEMDFFQIDDMVQLA